MVPRPQHEPLIQKEWQKLQGQPVHAKFKLLKQSIMKQNSEKFGNIDKKVVSSKKEIDKLDLIGEYRIHNQVEKARMITLQAELQARDKRCCMEM